MIRKTGAYKQLKGTGAALGFDETLQLQEFAYFNWRDGQVILIGTDGIWETENSSGEQFVKERCKDIMRRNAQSGSETMLKEMIKALADFRGAAPQTDDVTLVVIKKGYSQPGKTETVTL